MTKLHTSPTLLAVILLLGPIFMSRAQEPSNVDADFATKALAGISSRLAELEAKDAEDIRLKVQSEEQAQKALLEVQAEKASANLALEEADRRLKVIYVGLKSSPSVKEKAASSTAATGNRAEVASMRRSEAGSADGTGDGQSTQDAYRLALREKELAQKMVRNLAEAESISKDKLALEKARRENAERTAAENKSRRAEQFKELVSVRERWQANPTDDNQLAFLDRVTSVSCEVGAYANPFWRSKPSPGATILFQSFGARRRNEPIRRINNPSDARQEVCQGRYYVWSERNGKDTSDRNATPYDILVNTPEVTVTENP